jgi:hypothetical protein
MCKYIEDGTTVISDSWNAYRDFDSLGYTHLTVNHTLHFKDPNTGAHTTIESMWNKVKLFLGPYNRGKDHLQGNGGFTFPALSADITGV